MYFPQFGNSAFIFHKIQHYFSGSEITHTFSHLFFNTALQDHIKGAINNNLKMFVFCKDVKVSNYESHFYYGGANFDTLTRNMTNPERTKNIKQRGHHNKIRGLTMSKGKSPKKEENVQSTLRNAIKSIAMQDNSQNLIRTTKVIHNHLYQQTQPKRVHSIERKYKRTIISGSVDLKNPQKTINSPKQHIGSLTNINIYDTVKKPLNVSKCVQTDFDLNIPCHSCQCESKYQSHRYILTPQATLSTTLEATRKASEFPVNHSIATKQAFENTENQNTQAYIDRPAFKFFSEMEKQQSRVSKQSQNYSHSSKTGSFYQSMNENRDYRYLRDSKYSRDSYHINILTHAQQYLATLPKSQQQEDESWQNIRSQIKGEMKRVISTEKIQKSNRVSNHTDFLNTSVDYVVEQSLLRSHCIKSNFTQISQKIENTHSQGFSTQYLAKENELGLIVTLKSYAGNTAELVNRQLRNYELCGEHSHILNLYQHCWDQGQHILVKEPSFNLVAHKPLTESSSKTMIEAKKITDHIRSALMHLHSKGIFMRQLSLEDIRQAYGEYKISNLEKSVREGDPFISIQDNIKQITRYFS